MVLKIHTLLLGGINFKWEKLMTDKIKAPAMVYISGEEMTRYAMDLILKNWITPHIDTSDWQFFDLSVNSRDDTNDQVLRDAIDAGKNIKSIFKEPTITPTADQVKEKGLSQPLGSPNGVMRRGWNGISISRDTIHITGLELGYKTPVLFDRHAVGGEYAAGFSEVGAGKSVTTFHPANGGEPITIDERELVDDRNALVTYSNPLDNVTDLAHHFFSRSLEAGAKPYVVTKKTVFKWQEPFWQIMKDVYDADYKDKFASANIADDVEHLISDAACMKIPAWTDGGFSMVAHNYDGDMLTDLMSQIHRSPGFISSILVGIADDGTRIKEFEASHGTVTDMDQDRKNGKETSLNPIGMVDALIGAMNYSAEISGSSGEIVEFTSKLRDSMYKVMTDSNRGTRDLAGPEGSTTEQFIDEVAKELN